MGWVRVRKGFLCPICGKDSWCSISENKVLACCMRVESKRATKSGWLHTIGDEPAKPYTPPPRKTYRKDCPELAERYRGQCPLAKLGESLKVSVRSLDRLWCGHDGEAWTFPMRDGFGRIIGIRRRFASGKKLSLKNGRTGLFIPDHLNPGTLYVCEGPTDCAATLDLGVNAIGRPSCSTGGAMIQDFIAHRHYAEVIIVADNDKPKVYAGKERRPGQDGAVQLAFQLKDLVRRTTVILPKAKDIREWISNGATAESLKVLVKHANWIY